MIIAWYTTPVPDALVVCLDELGPVAVKTYPGPHLVGPATATTPRPRAAIPLDFGHRGGGYIYGAFIPATGQAFTVAYDRRLAVHWVDFLERLETWLTREGGLSATTCVCLVLDNLSAHLSTDAHLFAQAHPAWDFGFQPFRAAYLNLIESWWRVLRQLALAGRRFAEWTEIVDAVTQATAYWNAHRHPFIWGRPRPQRRKRRQPGVGRTPIFLPNELPE